MELTCTILLRPNPIPIPSAFASSSFYYRGFPLDPSGDDDLLPLVYEALLSPVQSVPVSLSFSASTLALKCWLVVDPALLPALPPALLPAPNPVQWLIPPILDLHNSKARDVVIDGDEQEMIL